MVVAGSWTAMYVVNTFIVTWILVVGFGFGGWASMANFINQVDNFGLFAKCYQCPPKAPHRWSVPKFVMFFLTIIFCYFYLLQSLCDEWHIGSGNLICLPDQYKQTLHFRVIYTYTIFIGCYRSYEILLSLGFSFKYISMYC